MARHREIMLGRTWLPCDLYPVAFLPTGVHAVCDRCGWRVAGGAGPDVLQCEAGRQISAGKGPVLPGGAVCLWARVSFCLL